MTIQPDATPAAPDKFTLRHAAVAAFFLEISLLAVLVIWLTDKRKPIEHKPLPVIMLSFPAPQPSVPQPKPAPSVKPAPRISPKPITHHLPIHHATSHSVPTPSQAAPDPIPSTTAEAPPAPDPEPQPHDVTPPPAPQPSPPVTDPHIQARFEDKVRASVQSAMRYPYAAKVAHIEGQSKVSFNYMDGVVTDAKVTISSNYAMLDTAALAAVANAVYPTPPKELTGKPLFFEVWVRFYQTGSAATD